MKLHTKVTMNTELPGRELHVRPIRIDKDLRRFLERLRKIELERQDKVELIMTLEEIGQGRSLDANALMWALYEIEADVDNGGLSGPGEVVKEDLYDADMMRYAPVVTLSIAADQLSYVRAMAKIKDVRLVGDGRLEVDVLITSSKWDTVRFAKHLDRQFNRLAAKGLPLSQASDVKRYWLEWRQHLNDLEIVLNDEPMSEEEYRERTPSCERCSVHVGMAGHLAHISSRGSGVTWGPEKRVPADWLHLCDGCHVAEGDSIHAGGWSAFLETAPHLRYKVMRALKREATTKGVKLDG